MTFETECTKYVRENFLKNFLSFSSERQCFNIHFTCTKLSQKFGNSFSLAVVLWDFQRSSASYTPKLSCRYARTVVQRFAIIGRPRLAGHLCVHCKKTSWLTVVDCVFGISLYCTGILYSNSLQNCNKSSCTLLCCLILRCVTSGSYLVCLMIKIAKIANDCLQYRVPLKTNTKFLHSESSGPFFGAPANIIAKSQLYLQEQIDETINLR